MSKLDDIFGRRYDQKLLVKVARPMKQEIKDLVLELIGEDEDEDMFRDDEFVSEARLNHYAPIVAKNDWRAELRKKVEAL